MRGGIKFGAKADPGASERGVGGNAIRFFVRMEPTEPYLPPNPILSPDFSHFILEGCQKIILLKIYAPNLAVRGGEVPT